ncbi:CdaR family protein [Desemzia incerta]|uniref:CdaR family protein n=1 Tax=Desemzia incerta TaxID=82801 RepID=UPI0024C2D289|nr:CdaR family protein [Desemzia incerta]WHZ33041.1 CdaR family protein [Desemzia incerta]
MMEKIMNSPWFLRIVALGFAALLFTYVNNENSKQINANNRSGGATVNSTEMITDLPVLVDIDQEKYFVTGIPDSVSILLEGSTAILLNTLTTKSFDIVTPDLNELGEGTYTIELLPSGLSDDLSYTIYPAEVKITIQERVSENYDVSVLFNEDSLARGYEAGEPIVDSETVLIEGAADTLGRIANVQVNVSAEENTNSDITQTLPVIVTDAAGNQLDVEVTPSEVSVTIPVTSNSRDVPMSLQQSGTPESGYTYELAIAEGEDTTANVVAEEAVLDALEEIQVPVDVTGVTESSTVEVTVPVPNGAASVLPETIEVDIIVTEEEAGNSQPNRTDEPQPSESSSAPESSEEESSQESEERESSESSSSISESSSESNSESTEENNDDNNE